MTIVSLEILYPKNTSQTADAGTYSNYGIPLILSTAYYKAGRNADSSASGDISTKREALKQNLKRITDESFGNVGLFIGPRSSDASDAYSAMQTPITLNEQQIINGNPIDATAAAQYQAFGIAIHKINERGLKIDPNDARLGDSLNSISSAATSLTQAGIRLLRDYNPAPVVLALLDSSKLNSAEYQGNKLIQIINGNDDVRGLINMFGSPSGLGPVPVSFVVMTTIVFLLFVTSVLMTLINGRAAGENIRKAMVRVLVAIIAVPIISQGLDLGINFLGDYMTDQETITQEEIASQHLNFADWYATGFAVPSGVQIAISEDGLMKMNSDIVYKINEHTYFHKFGRIPTAEEIATRLTDTAKNNDNQTKVSFAQPTDWTGGNWGTENIEKMAETLSKNDPNNLVTNTNDWYVSANSSQMVANGNGYTLSRNPGKNGEKYGISPIAANNLMQTTFTESMLTANSLGNYPKMVTVAHFANQYNGSVRMDPLIRFIATYTMVMAAISGLFTVITNGFGGIFAGGSKSVLGNTEGLGQAIGGVIALIGGVLGISIIMTMSFSLLDELYGVIMDLFSNVEGEASVLDPVKEIFEGIPLIGPRLANMASSFASFIISIMAVFALPKFGAIPIKMFCSKMAELPHVMAEKAQAIENKITGDFRGGSGGFGSGGNPFGDIGADAAARGDAIRAGAAAIGGYALSKIGGAISNKYGGKDGDKKEGDNKSLAEESTKENTNEQDGNTSDETNITDGNVDESMNTDGTEDATGDETANEDVSSDEGAMTSEEPSGDASVADSDEAVTGDEAVTSEDAGAGAEDIGGADGDTSLADGDMSADGSDTPTDTSANDSISETGDTTNDASGGDSSVADTASMSEANDAQGADKTNDGDNKTNGDKKSSTDSNKPNTVADDKMKQQSKRDKVMNAVGKGLSAAGGNTTGKQAIAGAIHIGGAMVGAQKHTGKLMDRADREANGKQDTRTAGKSVGDGNNTKTQQQRQNQQQMYQEQQIQQQQQEDEQRRRQRETFTIRRNGDDR